MTTSNYFFDDGKSRKFWSVTLDGKKQTIRHGRIGTEGRESTKTFPTAAAAEAATTRLANQKLAKGYIKVDSSKLIFHPEKDGKKPATKAQVASLEKRLGAKLPAEYKEFLFTRNGGCAERGYIQLPGPKRRRVGVGEIYGLYDEPKGFSLLWAVEKVMPRIPNGHLPISGWLDYCSLSLAGDVGCIYLWDEMAAPCKEFDAQGKKIFNAAHGVLVAGSFNEFLTRLVIYQEKEEADAAAAKSASALDQGTTQQETSKPKSKEFSPPTLSASGEKSPLPKRRQQEILRLANEGGDELTAAIAQGDQAGAKFRRKIHREIMEFLKTTTNKDELHLFADNWHWDSGGKEVLAIVTNPHVDAGTLLQIFWYACAEDYYFGNRSASEIKDAFDRDVFRVLEQVERRIVKGEYRTAVIRFDPSKWITMRERRSEFARPIPDVVYQPILGKKQRKR